MALIDGKNLVRARSDHVFKGSQSIYADRLFKLFVMGRNTILAIPSVGHIIRNQNLVANGLVTANTTQQLGGLLSEHTADDKRKMAHDGYLFVHRIENNQFLRAVLLRVSC